MGIAFPLAGLFIFPDYLIANLLISFGIIVQIGFGFELFSLITGKGHPEIMDGIATVAGGVLGVGLCLLGLKLF